MNPQTIELTSTDWTKIEFDNIDSDLWFSFWTDADMLFSEIPNPAIDETIPLIADTRFMYKRPNIFFVKWAIGDKVFLSPFER